MIDGVIPGAALPPLGWQHQSTYDPTWWSPIEDRPGWSVKPAGGLWTAPMHPDGGTAWTQWCRAEDYGSPDTPIISIIPDPDAKIFMIDDLERGLLPLVAAYPRVLPGTLTGSMFPPMSWEKVAADFDAVWLTEDGEWRTRFSNPSLYGWDCATVLWLQPRFAVGEKVAP